MQKTNNTPATINHTLSLVKDAGNLWMLRDITPFRMSFGRFFDEKLGHDFCKLTVISAANYVLNTLAGDLREMDIELRMSSERLSLPDYVEFALIEPGRLSSRYHVNNCPGCPQLQAWVSDSAKVIFQEYPAFAYIRKK